MASETDLDAEKVKWFDVHDTHGEDEECWCQPEKLLFKDSFGQPHSIVVVHRYNSAIN